MNPLSTAASRPLFTAHDLMREILQMTAQRWIDPESFGKIATAAGIRRTDARIFFLTQLKERVRLLPLKLFVSPEARAQMLEALQTALDQEISREEIT